MGPLLLLGLHSVRRVIFIVCIPYTQQRILLEISEEGISCDAIQMCAQQPPHVRMEALRHMAMKKKLRPAQVREYPKHCHIFNSPLPRLQRAVFQTL